MYREIPDSLVPGKLTIGPKGANPPALKNQGITMIVDLTQDAKRRKDVESVGLKYCAEPNLRVDDDFTPIPVGKLDYIVMMINRLISKGHWIYLHCSMGLGRSPTVAVAYLIYHGSTRAQAERLVRERRGDDSVLRGQDEVYGRNLDRFEEKYRGHCREL